MPIRMLRDWTRSKKMAKISSQGERMFVRLIMVSDDFGNYPANIKLINGNLFSEHEDVKDIDVAKWLDECVHIGLIRRYSVNETKYLHIVDFGQRLDKAKAKYPREHEDPRFSDEPHPPNSFRENPGSSGKIPPELETELEIETETEHEHAREESRLTVWPSFDDFWELYDKKVDRVKCEKKWKKISQGAREKIMQTLPNYIRGTPDQQYRKNPATYLNNQSWENEITTTHGKSTSKNDRSNFVNDELAIIANHVAEASRSPDVQ